ncbi:MAG: glycosyltransferase family 39 protein [Planctomycetota bacterium]
MPTQQGVEILDRPPLQYWTLALVRLGLHELDPLTLRLVQACVTLATALLVWWYAAAFLSQVGALAAGLCFATFGHVFDLGRRIETDGLFALLVVASLLVWHRLWTTGRSRALVWLAGGALAGLAALTKGIQAPVAFFGASFLWLLWAGRGGALPRLSTLCGPLAFVAVVAVWQVPCLLREGWEGFAATWWSSGAERYATDFSLSSLLMHVLEFPVRVAGATMPWSPLLLGLALDRSWRRDPVHGPLLRFLACGCAAVFVPVWISIYGHQRYTMPMYPLLAVLCGVVVDRATRPEARALVVRGLTVWYRVLAVLLAAFAVVLLVITVAGDAFTHRNARALAQPWPLLVVLLACAGLVLRLVWRGDARRPLVPLVALAALLALTANGPVVNFQAATFVDVGPKIRAFRATLPADTKLVSFEPMHHKFVYWYERRIPILPKPATAADLPADVDLVAVHLGRGQQPDLPFAWDEVARFSMDRREKGEPYEVVVVLRPRR